MKSRMINRLLSAVVDYASLPWKALLMPMYHTSRNASPFACRHHEASYCRIMPRYTGRENQDLLALLWRSRWLVVGAILHAWRSAVLRQPCRLARHRGDARMRRWLPPLTAECADAGTLFTTRAAIRMEKARHAVGARGYLPGGLNFIFFCCRRR